MAAEQFRVLSAPNPDPHHHHHNFVAEEVFSAPTPHPAPPHQKIVEEEVLSAPTPPPDLPRHQSIVAEEVLSATAPPPQKIRAIATTNSAQFLQSLQTPVPPTNFCYRRTRDDDEGHTRGRKRKICGSGNTTVVQNPLLKGRWLSPIIVESYPDLAY